MRTLLAVLFFTVFLAACGTQPMTTAPPDVATPPGEPVEAPVEPTPPTPTPAPEPCVCPEPEPMPVPALVPVAPRYLPVIGEVEHTLVDSDALLQKARIDSGATTTSVGFTGLEYFERDGESWVHFVIKDRVNGEVHDFKKRVIRTAAIKQHTTEAVKRPVVMMTLTIGDIERTVEVTLTNRDSFEFPVLIGRNFLHETALIDVSKRYMASGGDQE